MGVSKSSSSTAGDSGGEDLEPFAPSTPTPQNRGGLFRTPPNTTLAVESTTVTRRRGRGKATAAPVAPVPSEPRMDDRSRGASSDVEARQPTHPNSQSSTRRVTMSVKDLIDRMSHFGAKINTKLTGSDTFSQWDTVLRRKVRGLGATAALEGRREDVEDEEVWDIMDLSVLEMIIDSVMASMRTELEGKTATEAYTLLKNRYS
jgi:hypothetical protein